jgi:transcriptional regulator with XRE-family HTH domain
MEQPTLGIKITELRNAKDITQKELAERCKVDIRTIQRIEAGEVSPRAYTLKLLSEVLACNFNEQSLPVFAHTEIRGTGLKMAFIAGLMFAFNLVTVFYLGISVRSYGSFKLMFTLFCIQTISSFVFFGFYIKAKRSNNKWVAVSSLTSMALVLAMAILFLLNARESKFIVMMLLLISEAFFGLGVIIEGRKKENGLKPLYYVAGVLFVIQTGLCIRTYTAIAGFGLHLFCDVLLIAILYLEYQKVGKPIKFNITQSGF